MTRHRRLFVVLGSLGLVSAALMSEALGDAKKPSASAPAGTVSVRPQIPIATVSKEARFVEQADKTPLAQRSAASASGAFASLMGGPSEMTDMFVVLMAYLRMVQKEAREDRRIERLSSELRVAAKEAKASRDILELDAQMKEARDKADAAMGTAVIFGVIGVLAGAGDVAAALPDGGVRTVSTVERVAVIDAQLSNRVPPAIRQALRERRAEMLDVLVAASEAKASPTLALRARIAQAKGLGAGELRYLVPLAIVDAYDEAMAALQATMEASKGGKAVDATHALTRSRVALATVQALTQTLTKN